MFETVLYEKSEGIGYITLNRPRALNAVNLKMRDELYQVLGAVREDPEVGVVILRGAGERAFCAGADISEFGTAPSQAVARWVRWARDLWGQFLAQEKALIAAMHGFAVGAGIEMAMCCDFRLATPEAQFGLPEVGLGMVPTAGGSQTLLRHIPLGKALEMTLTGDRIGAAEALELGLVHKIVSREELLPQAQSLAQKLLAQPPQAVRAAKEAVARGLNLSLAEGLALETRLARRLGEAQAASSGTPAR